MNLSSSLSRPYIGSCHNRNYIYNQPSLLWNDYYFSTIRSSKSFLPRQFYERSYFSNIFIRNALLERVPIKYSSSPILLDERQLNQEQKAKSFLSSSPSSSSSSLVLFPTITPTTYYDHSSPFTKEQQKFSQPYQYEQKQIPNPSYLSLPSPFINIDNHDKIDQSHLLTSNDMSSVRYLTGTNPKTHTYDQRISDQGTKYIIQLKTDDYQENEFTITPRYYQHQIIIDAKHNEEDSLGGFVRRELHKIFLIPKHIDLNKYTYSYNKNTQELTIEMPYLQSNLIDIKSDLLQNKNQSMKFSSNDFNLTNEGITHSNTSGLGTTINDSILTNESNIKSFDFDLFHRSAFRPQIISTSKHENKLLMSLDLSDYQPEDIKISIKDQELIVKAEKTIETDTKKSRNSFFQSTSLPPQTDIEHLQSNYIDGKLIIEAPYLDRKIKTNQETIIESKKESITNDPYQQRTETVIEFIRRRRL